MSESISLTKQNETTKKSYLFPLFCAFGCTKVCCSFSSHPCECMCCNNYDSNYENKVKNTSCCYDQCCTNGNVGFICCGWCACDVCTLPCMSESKTCVPITCLCCMC